MKKINRYSLFANSMFNFLSLLLDSQPFLFSNFFTPALKGEVAENQAPFRVGVKLIFSMVGFRRGLTVPLLILLISCSPAKRLDYLLHRHPELTIPDTVTIRDTLISPGIQADTTLHLEQLYDTVILKKERLQVKLLRKTDTLWVEGTCNPDTLIIEKQIPVEKIKLVSEPVGLSVLKPALWLLAGLLLLALIMKLVINK